MVVEHRHLSLLWKVAEEAVRPLLTASGAVAQVITGTETNAGRWEPVLASCLPGFHVTREPGPFVQGDPWVAMREDLGPLIEEGVVEGSPTTYGGHGTDHKVFFAYQGRWLATGEALFALSAHWPSHSEGDLRAGRRTDHTTAYLEALRTLRKLILRLRSDYLGARFVVAGDWNVDFRDRWVREWLGDCLAGVGLRIPAVDDEGSFGPRLIDWCLSDLDTRGEVLRRPDGLDHHPVAFQHTIQETIVSYREAKSLATLLVEVNKAAPDRSKASDGWIGDAAHASRDSDHNPWVIDDDGQGVVRARDFTHDPAGGLDCNQLAEELAALLRAGDHPALGPGAYVIWNRRIISRNRIAEGWRAYTGSNDHTRHLHLSVAEAQVGYDSTKPWGVLAKERVTPHWDELHQVLDQANRLALELAEGSPEDSQRSRDAFAIAAKTNTARRLAAAHSEKH